MGVNKTSELIIDLNDKNWEAIVEKGDKPIVILFSSPTCPYCKQMEPFFNENAEQHKEKIIFGKVDITVSPTIANRYGVMGTPTTKFFCNGHPVFELVGVISPDILKKTIEETIENGNSCVKNTTWRAPEITGYT